MRYLFCIAFNQSRFVCRLLPRREILAPFLPFLCLRDRLFDLLRRRVRLPPFNCTGADTGGAGNCAVANKFGGANVVALAALWDSIIVAAATWLDLSSSDTSLKWLSITAVS